MTDDEACVCGLCSHTFSVSSYSVIGTDLKSTAALIRLVVTDQNVALIRLLNFVVVVVVFPSTPSDASTVLTIVLH